MRDGDCDGPGGGAQDPVGDEGDVLSALAEDELSHSAQGSIEPVTR